MPVSFLLNEDHPLMSLVKLLSFNASDKSLLHSFLSPSISSKIKP